MKLVLIILGLAAVALAAAAGPAFAGCAGPPGPCADFSWEPGAPLTHQPVTFNSAATPDPLTGDPIVSWEWDFDGDESFDEGITGQTASFTFARPGVYEVAHRVRDSVGGDTHRDMIRIGNRPPAASFFPSPANPPAGEPVTFVSTSSDPDGFIASHAWDLNDDGSFGDATTGSATIATPAASAFRIGLRVTDDFGASNSLVLAFARGPGGVLQAQPVSQSISQSVARARLMSPFPVVRVSGLVRRRGIKLRVLSVTAPHGATVSVLCRGRGCTFRSRESLVVPKARSAAALAPSTGLVRIRRLGRRLLRVGTTVRVFVSSKDAVGKYTRLKVRKGKPPARIDRCVAPASRTPIACPAD